MSALYGQIECGPPSGSSPDDWYLAAKKLFKSEKKEIFMCEEAWQILRHAFKWANSGVFIPVATGNFQALTPPDYLDFEVRPPSQKQTKKLGREELAAGFEEDKKAVIDRVHELAVKWVQAQEYCNQLSKAMIDLEA